ncbi:MAG: rRNA maturation RNase YbeY [Coriobacteriales bacterium]|jgi:probable rRNA maturation factor|nr:rRNA maturation RNase YbeY [Coriobacteriales bacterium]
MDIQIDNRSGEALPLEHVVDLARFVLEREGMAEALEVSLSFVTVEEITTLNAVYRDRPEATDVLSFECDAPDTSEAAFEGEASGDQEAETVVLGDIVICPELARTRALQEEVSLEEELWILVIHGILHLLGHDHLNKEDAQAMEAREDEYFSLCELKREGTPDEF